MSGFNELKLIKELKKGDIAAFEELYSFYSKKVYNFISRYVAAKEDVEEIVQEIFLAIWKNREAIKAEEPFVSYLFGISRNKINTYLRNEVYGRASFEYLFENNKDLSFVTEETIRFNELQKHLDKIINELPPRRKEIFILGKIDGLTYKQIAKKLDISENTVDTQMRAALNFVRSRLKFI